MIFWSNILIIKFELMALFRLAWYNKSKTLIPLKKLILFIKILLKLLLGLLFKLTLIIGLILFTSLSNIFTFFSSFKFISLSLNKFLPIFSHKILLISIYALFFLLEFYSVCIFQINIKANWPN